MKIIIIGGGPAALMAADVLSKHCEVAIYEKEKSIGRKFLVAGKGGFNLTNGLDGEALFAEYSPKSFLKEAILSFGSEALRAWLEEIEIPTFVGSSGRVFPVAGIKPVEVLNKIREKLLAQCVEFYLKHEFIGFNSEIQPIVKNEDSQTALQADAYIFALGGASWSKTGSTGDWVKSFESIGVSTVPFQASNCGINIKWPEPIKVHHSGKPLKNIGLSLNDHIVKGEATITEYGLEGNAIYPLTPSIRQSLNTQTRTEITLDFKPFNTKAQLLEKIHGKKIKTSTYSTFFNLNSTQLALIKAYIDKESFLAPDRFVAKIKALKIPVKSLRPIEEAISTVGGVALSEVSPDFSLKKHPKIFVIGEMLDWDAPTGGFLLQGCFSMGHRAGEGILRRLKSFKA